MNTRIVVFFLPWFIFLPGNPVQAQQDSISSTLAVAVLPLVYYTPETSWVFGAGVVGNFRLGAKNGETYESQVAVGAGYSLLDQLLIYTSWRIFTAGNRDLLAGELGGYRYVYFFYGIGNDLAEDSRESYSARFPRVRFDYGRGIGKQLYLGFRFWGDDYRITEVKPNGLLATGEYSGRFGGRNYGVGPLLVYDSRDDQLYPRSGFYMESSVQGFGKFLGGEFGYWRLAVDLRKVYSLSENQVVAGNLYTEFTSGNVPFFAIPMLGGNKRMRGLFEGKFRDRHMWVLQGEYRWKFSQRWGIAAFSGVGDVHSDSEPLSFQNTKITYGLGGRFQLTKRKKLNLRLDLAHSQGEDWQIYFTFGEAF